MLAAEQDKQVEPEDVDDDGEESMIVEEITACSSAASFIFLFLSIINCCIHYL